ncbi:hypothetical protein [Kordia sp.]|uniref:hypothetical protein n=1 Tax=Kordia sp. TaxID=1965332 RepID=UPI003B5A3D39
MKLRINPLASDVIITIYAVATLFVRLKYESEANVSTMNSLIMGICFVVIIWALIKLKVLNPNWFGLFNPKKSKS